MIGLATCSWRAYRPEMGVAVRITLGTPPRWFDHPYEEVRLLAPPPHVFRLSDWDEFRRKYRHHLHRTTSARLRTIFEAIGERHPGRRLVLLCFESDPADCHRGLWAEWWFQQTGERMPELRPEGEEKRPDGPQPSLFDGEETA